MITPDHHLTLNVAPSDSAPRCAEPARKLPRFDIPNDAYTQTGYDFEFESGVYLTGKFRAHRDNDGNLKLIGAEFKGYCKGQSATIYIGLPLEELRELENDMREEAALIEKA